MNLFLVILEDRHTDVHVEAYSTKEAAIERFKEIVADYDFTPEEPDKPIDGWLAHATLSRDGDYIRVEEIELDQAYEL